MSRATSIPEQATAIDPAAKVEELRVAVNQLFASERRLRGRDHSRPGELTFAQLRTVAALGREDEMTAGQLARSAELTPAAVTAILDQLEEANIVERRRSTADRRVCNVALTPDGRELLDRKLASWQQFWADGLAGFNDQELTIAARVVNQITGMLNTVSTHLDSAQAKNDQAA
jgi:MarR family transcriptional regulator, organic hydroperoxide resistance regulator